MVITALIIIFTILLSIFLHEVGHYVAYFNYTGKRIKFTLSRKEIVMGEEEDYRNLTKKQKLVVLGSGIIAGLFPVLLISDWGLVGNLGSAIIFTMYMMGCLPDIIELAKVTNVSHKIVENESKKKINTRRKK